MGRTRRTARAGSKIFKPAMVRRLDIRQTVEIGAQYVAMQDEIGEFAVADDLDETGGLQLLDVVREGGRADVVALVQAGAGQRRVLRADALENGIALGLGQRPGDPFELAFRENCFSVPGHDGKISSRRWKSSTQPPRGVA